jgi:hypothetical protein
MRDGDGASILFRFAESVVNIAHVPKECLYYLRLPIAISSSATVQRSFLTSTLPSRCIALTTRLFVDLSKVDHAAITERDHICVMVPKSKMLTREEFASLLTVGNTRAVLKPPAVIPVEHSARLIALGYMVDLAGRLRMTTPGRLRIRKQTHPQKDHS